MGSVFRFRGHERMILQRQAVTRSIQLSFFNWDKGLTDYDILNASSTSAANFPRCYTIILVIFKSAPHFFPSNSWPLSFAMFIAPLRPGIIAAAVTNFVRPATRCILASHLGFQPLPFRVLVT